MRSVGGAITNARSRYLPPYSGSRRRGFRQKPGTAQSRLAVSVSHGHGRPAGGAPARAFRHQSTSSRSAVVVFPSAGVEGQQCQLASEAPAAMYSLDVALSHTAVFPRDVATKAIRPIAHAQRTNPRQAHALAATVYYHSFYSTRSVNACERIVGGRAGSTSYKERCQRKPPATRTLGSGHETVGTEF